LVSYTVYTDVNKLLKTIGSNAGGAKTHFSDKIERREMMQAVEKLVLIRLFTTTIIFLPYTYVHCIFILIKDGT
jgi:hypothetical protein